MQVKILGASGSEGPGFNSPAFLIDDFMLLDAGTIAQALDERAQSKITHIFITHAHLDHIKGVAFLLDNISLNEIDQPLRLLSGREVIAQLRKHIFNGKIWPDFTALKYPDYPVMCYQEISTRGYLEVKGYRIFAVRVNHTVPAYGYIVEHPARGILIYTGDTGPTERIWQRMGGKPIKSVIVDVSFPDEMTELAVISAHLTPALLEKELQKMPAPPHKTYVTHVKPHYREKIREQLLNIKKFDIEILKSGDLLTF